MGPCEFPLLMEASRQRRSVEARLHSLCHMHL